MNNETTPWVDPADQQLVELLTAAGAPGTDTELRDEEHSVVMFHMAHLESITARRESMSPTPSTRRIAARTVAAAIAAFVLATTGIALAATGNFPGNSQGNGVGKADDVVPSPVAVSEEATEDDQGEDEQGDFPSDEVSDESEGDSSDTTTDDIEESTSQGFRGVCRAITVGNKAEHGNALEAPPFVALVEAAGGIENVKDYCTELVGTRTHPAKGERPEKPTKPTKPEHPAKPDHPNNSNKGERPDKPGKPDHANQGQQEKDHPVKP